MSAISLGFIIIGNELDLLNRLLEHDLAEHRAVGRLRAAGSVILWVMEIVKFFGRRSDAAETVRGAEPSVRPHRRPDQRDANEAGPQPPGLV